MLHEPQEETMGYELTTHKIFKYKILLEYAMHTAWRMEVNSFGSQIWMIYTFTMI